MAVDQLIPTRMELMKIKDRKKLAERGHKLLKQKRDALIMEFFKIYSRASNMREQLNDELYNAYMQMVTVEIRNGPLALNVAAEGMPEPYVLEVTERNVMGVRIPEVKKEGKDNGYKYSVMTTDYGMDETIASFQKVLAMILELAETENALKRIIKDIEKTKRRVNALEYILIPRLEEQAKQITLRLEEMERESFFVLKQLKSKH
ncbi:MAG: V-type ATP synthase subunit D [Candidatus Micrarchaeia archaeon]